MLRILVLLLLLANGAFFAWSGGAFALWGFAPAQQAEPQRMQQQIRPEAVRVLSAEEARRVEATARPAECLQAGPFDEAQIAALRKALDSWPVGSWNMEPGVEPARWIVYMGRYANLDALNRKKGELRQRGVSFETVGNPGLEPGMSLGGAATEAAAQQLLDGLSQRGVRTARVIQERAEVRGQVLKLLAVDDTLRSRLDDLRSALEGRLLHACR